MSLSTWPELSSYPIEVGVAIADAACAITSWSALIRPDARWRSQGEWDRRSERVHGILREELDAGLSPAAVATELNDRLAPYGTVWCDGGRYDAHWLTVLFATAGIEPAFVLADLATLLAHDLDSRLCYEMALEQRARQHRAEADSRDICTALVFAIARA